MITAYSTKHQLPDRTILQHAGTSKGVFYLLRQIRNET